MKIQLVYFFDQYNTSYTHWCRTMFKDHRYVGCGLTWKEARESLMRDIDKAVKLLKAGELEPPPSEEVEIDLEAAHANQG